jgi:hypothetical protein
VTTVRIFCQIFKLSNYPRAQRIQVNINVAK